MSQVNGGWKDARAGEDGAAGDAHSPRRVLIIGGSGRIGRTVVERFARGGDHVWFTYRSGRQRALALVDELSAQGRQAAAFEFDQGNWSSHECLSLQLPGPVDVLVNNAVASHQTIEHFVPGPRHRREAALLWINSVGPLWLIRQLLPGMLDRGRGAIINVAGTGGALAGVASPPDHQVADGMSKAALAYLTKHLAAELAHQPVGVFAICLGAVDPTIPTQDRRAYPVEQRPPEWGAGLSLRRLTRPGEIAELVWWLASDAAEALRGTVIDTSLDPTAHSGLRTDWAANGMAGRTLEIPWPEG